MGKQMAAKTKKKASKGMRRVRLALIVILILLFFFCVALGMVYYSYKQDELVDRSPIVIVDGSDISGMSADQASDLILAKYPWSMKVVYEGGEYPIEDIFTPIVRATVEDALREESIVLNEQAGVTFEEKIKRLFDRNSAGERVRITRQMEGLSDVDMLAAQVAGDLEKDLATESKDSDIVAFGSDGFEISESVTGRELDSAKLTSEIKEALLTGDYTAEIPVSFTVVEPSVTKSQFKTISTYTTHTTNNENRNTNVRLAAQAIDGMIIAPGETFSFNQTVGKRTPEKGYKEAAAYSDGVTVQEYGGGVCQVSSTLYNAVIGAGLETKERTGHTFEPTYVTPGQDATVSYMNPDFSFINNSGHSIGIRASYANRTMTVDIIGVPVLKEGEKMYLSSEKTGDAPAGYTYVEDPTIPFGTEEIISAGKPGSVWKTYIVIEENGKEVSKEYLHTTRYRGHEGTIRHNTTNPAIVAPPAPPAPPAQ